MRQFLEDFSDLVGEGEPDSLDPLLDVLDHGDVHVPVEVREELLHRVQQVRHLAVGPLRCEHLL